MFKELPEGETQCCMECNEKQKTINKLEKENERLKNGIKHYQRAMYKIKSIAEECRNSKEWNY